jgi:methylated-DNA-protein-cysteine methyltransferase related protein
MKKAAQIQPLSDADRILAAVRRIPRGCVSTYGQIADVAGLPRRARLVGTVLKHAPASRDLPWFRVINSSGRISLPSGSDSYLRQRRKLEAEGVIFRGDRVDMKRYGWPPSREASLDELLWNPESLAEPKRHNARPGRTTKKR